MINDFKYIRDGRSPIPTSNVTSKVMSANRAKNTKPEISLRKALWSVGLRGYRVHLKNLIGRPDVVFPIRKLAIFVNGCFWHRCPHCQPHEPKSNKAFWLTKFHENQARDLRKSRQLQSLGWSVVTIWECEIKNQLNNCINRIQIALNR